MTRDVGGDGVSSRVGRAVRGAALAVATPLLEKNARKTVHLGLPFVLSMARLIVVAFAAVLIRLTWRHGVPGWPQATESIAVVLALPILNALERVDPKDVVALASTMLGRFGIGAVESREPSKYDDHRED